MGSISGSSTVYSYGNEGGIMLMGVNENIEHGTITGGSGDDAGGNYGIPARIYWSITYGEDGTYSGGITENSFFTKPLTIYNTSGVQEIIYGPFVPYDGRIAELYSEAFNNGNLDQVFQNWNNNYPDSVTKFISYLEDNCPRCVSTGVVTG